MDQIAKTVDYKALQESIRQITYCDAGKEFDSEATDPNLVKVFRMSQLIIEYLLQSQDFLANNLASVEQRLNSTLEVGYCLLPPWLLPPLIDGSIVRFGRQARFEYCDVEFSWHPAASIQILLPMLFTGF